MKLEFCVVESVLLSNRIQHQIAF